MMHVFVKNDFLKTVILLSLTAVLLAMANAAYVTQNFKYGFLFAYVALCPALMCLKNAKSRKIAFWQGFFWAFLYHLFILHWFTSLHDMTWVGFSPLQSVMVAHGIWVIASVLEGLFFALMWLACFCVMQQQKISMWIKPLLMGGIWSIMGNLIHQFMPCVTPVGFLAYSQSTFPVLMHSTYYLTFWGLEALLFAANVYFTWQALTGKIVWISLLAFPFGLGLLAEKIPENTAFNNKNVLIADALVTIDWLKSKQYSPETLVQKYQTDVNYRITQDTQLIVLPEAVLPNQDTAFSLTNHHVLASQNKTLLAGGYVYKDGKFYNSLIIRQANYPQQIISKRILVNFGETTPFVSNDTLRSFLKQFGIEYQASLDAAPFGQKIPSIQLPFPLQVGQEKKSEFKIGAFICFEALYPNLNLLYKQQKIDLLVTVSNLAWFHNDPQLQKQFLVANQFRAAELHKPLILATIQGDNKILKP